MYNYVQGHLVYVSMQILYNAIHSARSEAFATYFVLFLLLYVATYDHSFIYTIKAVAAVLITIQHYYICIYTYIYNMLMIC